MGMAAQPAASFAPQHAGREHVLVAVLVASTAVSSFSAR